MEKKRPPETAEYLFQRIGGRGYVKKRIFRKEGMRGVLERLANFQNEPSGGKSSNLKGHLKVQPSIKHLKIFQNEGEKLMIPKTA